MSSIIKENVNVYDRAGFIYRVDLEHRPYVGTSIALYNGSIIAYCNLGKISKLFSDSDIEWEKHEERVSEWIDEIKTNLIPQCEKYFNEL